LWETELKPKIQKDIQLIGRGADVEKYAKYEKHKMP
jgi:hypothetical protein